MGWFNWVVLAEEITEDEEDGGKYYEQDASNDTNVTNKEVANAWHTARDDAEEDGEITRTRNR